MNEIEDDENESIRYSNKIHTDASGRSYWRMDNRSRK